MNRKTKVFWPDTVKPKRLSPSRCMSENRGRSSNIRHIKHVVFVRYLSSLSDTIGLGK